MGGVAIRVTLERITGGFRYGDISVRSNAPAASEIDRSYGLAKDFHRVWHLYIISGDEDGAITYSPLRLRPEFLAADTSGYASLKCGRSSVFVHGVKVAIGSGYGYVFTACNAHALHFAVCPTLVMWGEKLL